MLEVLETIVVLNLQIWHDELEGEQPHFLAKPHEQSLNIGTWIAKILFHVIMGHMKIDTHILKIKHPK